MDNHQPRINRDTVSARMRTAGVCWFIAYVLGCFAMNAQLVSSLANFSGEHQVVYGEHKVILHHRDKPRGHCNCLTQALVGISHTNGEGDHVIDCFQDNVSLTTEPLVKFGSKPNSAHSNQFSTNTFIKFVVWPMSHAIICEHMVDAAGPLHSNVTCQFTETVRIMV